MACHPLPQDEDREEENVIPPLSFTPSATTVHPMAIVFSLVMEHVHAEGAHPDDRCCRPYRYGSDDGLARDSGGRYADTKADKGDSWR